MKDCIVNVKEYSLSTIRFTRKFPKDSINSDDSWKPRDRSICEIRMDFSIAYRQSDASTSGNRVADKRAKREREREEQRKKKNDTMHVGRERGTEAKER